jgi:hypothetical protein
MANISDLSRHMEKANMLQQRLNQSRTTNQFINLAKEAAKLYHIIANMLLISSLTNRDQLVGLSNKVSLIENEALIKSQGHSTHGPTHTLL